MLFELIPSAVDAVATWDAGVEDSGGFVITDVDLMVLSADSRRDMQDELVERSCSAGYVLEWRRDPVLPQVAFTWARIGGVL